ncbi:MAG: DMT family transporter [Pseudomonadota bacterium]
MEQAPVQSTSNPALPRAGLLLLIGLTFVWGFNWPVMKIALTEISVWWFRGACLVFGGLGLLALAAISGQRLTVARHEFGALLLTSVFAVMGWHVLTGFGVTMMPAGRAVIIAFTMPVWAALASAWLLGERITPLTVIGLALGLCGLAVLIGPDLVTLEQAPIGALFMLGGAICWAIGTVLFKRFAWTASVVTTMAWQLLAAAIPVTAIAVWTEPPPNPFTLSEPVLWAVAYVILLPMTFGQWAYFRIVKLFPATVAALGTLAIPIVGVYSSAILLGEAVGNREVIALGLTCAALATILLLPNILARRTRP